jgi:transcription elongation factor Elf1
MRKRKEIRNYQLSLNFKCPNTGKEVISVLSNDDFEFSSQDCDICGSHGYLTVNVKCYQCNKNHELYLRDW